MSGTNEADHSSTSGRRPTLAGNLCRSHLPVDFVTSFGAVLFQPNLSPLADALYRWSSWPSAIGRWPASWPLTSKAGPPDRARMLSRIADDYERLAKAAEQRRGLGSEKDD